MFQGALTAMATPFRDNRLDFERLRQNVEYQIDSGADGLVPTGTTGESPTLSHEEHNQLVTVVVEAAAGRVPVIAGTGSNSTQEALMMSRHAAEIGADATLQVVPYYNKPTQEGMYRHFMTIAEEVGLPVILYNIPGRCGTALTPATIARLAEHPNIVAVKEATGSMDNASEITTLCDIEIFSGDDSLTLPLMGVGAKGVISVIANIIPGWIHKLTDLALNNDFDGARRMHRELFPLFKAMFLETNPIPIKAAMKMMGMDTGEIRLPLTELTENNAQVMRERLKQQGLLD